MATDPVVVTGSTSFAVLLFHLVAWMQHFSLLSESLQVSVVLMDRQWKVCESLMRLMSSELE